MLSHRFGLIQVVLERRRDETEWQGKLPHSRRKRLYQYWTPVDDDLVAS